MKNFLTKTGLLFLFILSSCMDEDLDKLGSSVNIDAAYAIPLIHSTTDLLDMLPENENMVIDPDNAIRIVYRQDSIASVSSDSLLQIDDQEPTSESFEIGPVDLTPFDTEVGVQLSSLSSNLSNQTVAAQITEGIALSENNGSAYFPPITPQSAGVYAADGSDEFQSIFITEGQIEIQITNNFPVTISSLTLMLKNNNPSDQSQLGMFMFNNIDPNSIAVSSTSLNGVDMYSDLELEIVSISSEGSGLDPSDQSSWVPMSGTDELSIVINGQDMVATSGLVKYPADDNGPGGSFDIDLELEDEVELSYIDLSQGDFVYTYTSDVQTAINLTISIPQLVNASNDVYTKELTILPSSEPVIISEPIGNYNFDFSETPNLVEVSYSSTVSASESYEEYDQSHAVELNLAMQNLDFDLVEGYFGQTEQEIEEDVLDIDVSAIEDIASGIVLEAPVMRLTSYNSMDVPFEIDLNLVGQNETEELSLDGPAFAIEADATTISEYNNSNSQLVDLIAMSPNEISYSGTVLSNPNGQSENSISANSSISFDMEMDLPLYMRIEDALTTDTLALEFGDEEGEETDVDFIESVQLKLHTENEFPMDIAVTMFFADSISGIVQDSLVFDLLQAAEVDEDGKTIEPRVYDSNIGLDADQIDALFNSNQALLDIRLNSYDSENTAVRLYTDYRFVISAGVLLELKSDE